MSFLSQEELEAIGFKKLGKQVKLSRKTSIYGASKIEIGDYSRIDDFCILSAGEGGIKLGRNVHIACYVGIIGKGKIEVEDFCGISSKATLYSSTDDFSGHWMSGPTVDEEFTSVIHGDIIMRKHSVVLIGSVVLPNVEIGIGSIIAAQSLVSKNVEPFIIAGGIPAKKIKDRKKKFLDLEKEFFIKKQKNN